MGLTILYKIFPDISHTEFECGWYLKIFYGIFSVPHNIVMDLNNVMYTIHHPLVNFYVHEKALSGGLYQIEATYEGRSPRGTHSTFCEALPSSLFSSLRMGPRFYGNAPGVCGCLVLWGQKKGKRRKNHLYLHNIIQIHNNAMGLTLFCGIFHVFSPMMEYSIKYCHSHSVVM